MVFDNQNKIYFLDNHLDEGVGKFNRTSIWRISTSGDTACIYRSLEAGYADGPLSVAKFGFLAGVCTSPDGSVYVADETNHRIRKINLTTKMVTTFAGSGLSGHQDGQGTAARFAYMHELKSDAAGNLYVLTSDQTNYHIRKITPSGQVSTLLTTTQFQDNENAFQSIIRTQMHIDAAGNIYVSLANAGRIYQISPSGSLSLLVGTKDEKAPKERGYGVNINIGSPQHICGSANDSLFFFTRDYSAIYKIKMVAPKPPAGRYLDIPGSLCAGSTLDVDPVKSGPDNFYANRDSFTVTQGGPKAMTRGKNNDLYVVTQSDTILHYQANGTIIDTLNTNLFATDIKDLVVDEYGRMYVISGTSLVRLNANGFLDFSYGPGSVFSEPVALDLGPDGNLYISDVQYPGIYQLDTLTGSTANVYAVRNDIRDIGFDKSNRMHLLSKADKKMYVTALTPTPSFTESLPGLDTMGMDFDRFYLDTLGYGAFYLSSTTTGKVAMLNSGQPGANTGSVAVDSPSLLVLNDLMPFTKPVGITRVTTTLKEPYVWIADESGKLKTFSVFAYSISPSLPAGLSFDFHTGKIVGVPTGTAPATTYTLTRYSESGTASSTINFSVDPPGPVSNATASTTTGRTNHPDGLTINYYERNNCAEILRIEDEAGGTKLGKVEVKQERFPTIASFASGKFVPRVTSIETQDPNAPARLVLYFTHLDIKHYNESNGSDPDLSNDTIAGTMQVGILQLHTNKETGKTEQIKHNPVTATWKTLKKVWEVNFVIDKFSVFLAAEPSVLTSFDCNSAVTSETKTACGNYIWRNRRLSESGTYYDTLQNISGCDSVLALNLTITNDMAITQTNEVLTCNQTGATSYKWVNCDNNYALISGATNRIYTATTNGNYAVIVDANGCVDTSSCVYVYTLSSGTTGKQEQLLEEKFRVYPNPSTGIYNVDMAVDYTLQLTNVMGAMLLQEHRSRGLSQLDLSDMPSGVYYLTVKTEQGSQTRMLVKN